MTLRILILEDRFSLRHSMVNLGDRAYHVGLHDLLHITLDCELRSGHVKTLPWFTSRRTRNIKSREDAERLLDRETDRLIRRARNIGRFQPVLAKRIADNLVTRSRMFRRLDERFRHRLARGIVETISPFLLRKHYAAELVQSIEQSDLVIFNGGAFISDHLDKYLPMVMLQLYLAKRLGKPVMVVNQTVSIAKPSNRALVGFVYSLLDKHLVREPRSRPVLKELGVAADRIVLSADAAFGLKPAIDSRREMHPAAEGHSGTIGLCVRGDRPVPVDFWAGIIRMLQDEFGRRVVLFFTSEFQDRAAFDKIAAVEPAETLDRFYDYPELIDKISSFELVITDRYHAVVFAMLAGTPVVPIDSNTFKTRGLMDLAEYPLEVLANDGNLEKARRHIDHALRNRAELVEAVRSGAEKLARLAATSMLALQVPTERAQRPSSDAYISSCKAIDRDVSNVSSVYWYAR